MIKVIKLLWICGLGLNMTGSIYAQDDSVVKIGVQSGLKIKAPNKGAFHGAYLGTEDNISDPIDMKNRIEAFEKKAGLKAQIVTIQSNWQGGIKFPIQITKTIYDSGRIPLVRILPVSDSQQQTGKPDPVYDLRKMAQGDFDQQLIDMLRSIAELKGNNGQSVSVMIVFGPEVNGSWYRYNGSYYGKGETDKWGDPNVADGPEIFRDSYKRLIDLSRRADVNAQNITWAMHFDLHAQPSKEWNLMEKYYPGDEYIDWIGLSAFGAQTISDLPWYDGFEDAMMIKSVNYRDRWSEFSSVSSKAEKAIFEYALIEDPATPGRKAQWIKEALQVIPEKFSNLKMVSYWNEAAWIGEPNSNLTIDSSESSQEAYKNGVNQPFFQARLLIDGNTD